MKNNGLNFEGAIMKLEDIVAKLESGSLTLDESISEFEEAVGLIKLCEEKLSSAKHKVKILTEGEDGSITDMPFVNESNDEA